MTQWEGSPPSWGTPGAPDTAALTAGEVSSRKGAMHVPSCIGGCAILHWWGSTGLGSSRPTWHDGRFPL